MKKNIRKKPAIDPIPKFKIGDRIKHPIYGWGIVKRIRDGMFPDYDFFYDIDFTGRGGDGTKAWLPKAWTERKCTLPAKRA